MDILLIMRIMNVMVAGVLAIICFCDIRWRQIPVVLIGILLGLSTVSGILNIVTGTQSIMNILMAAAPGLFLVLLALTTQSVGAADGPILIGMGLTVGAQVCFMAFFFSLVLTGLFGIVMMIFRKYNNKTQVPYCPFVAGAFALVLTMGL